jgi:hypothetical protein
MKSLPLILSTGALALFAAGCGGDDEKTDGATTGGTASGETRGYAETTQAVNDICTRANAEIKPLTEKATGKADNDAPLLEDVVEVNEKYVAELKEIKPDPKLKEAFDAYVASIDVSTEKADEALSAAQSGDQAAYDKALEELSAADDANDPLAAALGAKECNKD